jgi:DNA anti-recombination protein RmuC
MNTLLSRLCAKATRAVTRIAQNEKEAETANDQRTMVLEQRMAELQATFHDLAETITATPAFSVTELQAKVQVALDLLHDLEGESPEDPLHIFLKSLASDILRPGVLPTG